MSKPNLSHVTAALREKRKVPAALIARAFKLNPKQARAKLRNAGKSYPVIRSMADVRRTAKLMGATTH